MAEGLARSLYRRFAAVSERHQRAQLSIATGTHGSPHPTVYFLTPDYQTPAGGIRVIYRHVDILNAAGMRARVLHRRQGFRCRWFDNDTQVTSLPETILARDDLLVVPELDIDALAMLPAGFPHVIFNQNAHLTWKRGAALAKRIYGGPDLRAVITVSSHNEAMLRAAFGSVPFQRIHLGIDPELFRPGDMPGRRMAYMPRRGRDDAAQVLAMLETSGAAEGWEIVALDGLSHAEVADALRTTSIFLAFTHQEGFGLPAAEAMACGNYVIGNHGQAGLEFFRPDFSFAVESGDIVGFVKAIGQAVAAQRKDETWCRVRGLAASRFIHATYSPRRESAEISAIYRGLLTQSRSPMPA